jgi:hypothetical protein
MAEAAASPSGPAEPALDEVMMAMDVVDTLRHEERMIARDLAQDRRDAELKRRLRDIYGSQGLEVTDRILEEGIAALRESRFVYEPPRPGWRVWLARGWIARWKIGPPAALAVVALLGWLGWSLATGGAKGRLAARLGETAAAAEALATAAPARARIAEGLDAGQRALAAGDLGAARAAAERLDRLRGRIGLAYDLRVVSRPGEPSGVYRIPDANSAARNYYLIVEAIGPDGGRLALPVTSEETGRTETVETWGLRVPEATFEAVARDKQDDGIIQDARVATKPRGALEPQYAVPVLDGAITGW